jgi:hypothetical protein
MTSAISFFWLVGPTSHALGVDVDSNVLKAIGDITSAFPSFTDAESSLQDALKGNQPSKVVSFADLAAKTRAITAVDFSILWPKFQESMATGARKCCGQLLELGI